MASNVYCAVHGCLNTKKNSQLSFFKLPTDCQRRHEWLKLIDRDDLMDIPKSKSGSYRVCAKHFDESMIVEVRLKNLVPNARPTKFLPNENETQPSTSKNELSAFDVSTQTNDSFIQALYVAKMKGTATGTTQQTEGTKEKELQTGVTVTENTSSKKKKRSNVQHSKQKKKKLDN